MLVAVASSFSSFMGPASLAPSKVSMSKISMGGKGFGGGEATRDPEPTVIDPNDPKGKQQAIHKAESFAEYLARRQGGGGDAAAAPAAAAPAAGGGGGDIAGVLSGLQGPEIFWGPEGPLQDPMKEESELKEYDTFSSFVAACSANGVDLSQPGITVLAPANVAVAEYEAMYGPLTKDVCAYHVIMGEVSTDALSSAPLTTLQGSTITYRRMFRKDFVDNAFCGVKASPPRSSYAANVKASNGYIHGINEVIYPGWSESAGGYGSQN